MSKEGSRETHQTAPGLSSENSVLPEAQTLNSIAQKIESILDTRIRLFASHFAALKINVTAVWEPVLISRTMCITLQFLSQMIEGSFAFYSFGLWAIACFLLAGFVFFYLTVRGSKLSACSRFRRADFNLSSWVSMMASPSGTLIIVTFDHLASK